MSKQNSNNTTIIIVVIVFIVAMIIGGINGNSSNKSSNSEPSNSVEYNYAKEKFRQSGQSERDSATAAEAVIKFQRAQDARRNK